MVDGSSQAELEKNRDSWSILTVVTLATVLTLVILGFVGTVIAKMGGRGRGRAAGGGLGGSGSGGVVNNRSRNGTGGHNSSATVAGKVDTLSNESFDQGRTLINKAFQESHDQNHYQQLMGNGLTVDKSPDVIPANFNGKKKTAFSRKTDMLCSCVLRDEMSPSTQGFASTW